MSEGFERANREGVVAFIAVLVVLFFIGLVLVGWISDTSAQKAQAQQRIEAVQQQGKTERAQTFALTLAGITAMGTASGAMPFVLIGLIVGFDAGLFYVIWRDYKRHGGGV